MVKMSLKFYIIPIIIFLLIQFGSATNNTTNNQTIHGNQTNVSITDGLINTSTSSGDQQFLFLMNQYWIPDFYDIKGRIDGAAGFGSDVPQMLNLSADYARIRLLRNINETNGYSISPTIIGLRTQYQAGALRGIKVIDSIMAQNRTAEGFAQDVPMKTAALSLYGTWLEYQVMRCYNLPNITYPDIATVPPDKFMQVMGLITS